MPVIGRHTSGIHRYKRTWVSSRSYEILYFTSLDGKSNLYHSKLCQITPIRAALPHTLCKVLRIYYFFYSIGKHQKIINYLNLI